MSAGERSRAGKIIGSLFGLLFVLGVTAGMCWAMWELLLGPAWQDLQRDWPAMKAGAIKGYEEFSQAPLHIKIYCFGIVASAVGWGYLIWRKDRQWRGSAKNWFKAAGLTFAATFGGIFGGVGMAVLADKAPHPILYHAGMTASAVLFGLHLGGMCRLMQVVYRLSPLHDREPGGKQTEKPDVKPT